MAGGYPEYTVSDLTKLLKSLIEGSFANIIVEGEVSGWRRYPSGHCYFTLKDAGAQIPAVMFAGPFEASCARRAGLREGLKDGAKVKAYGTVTVYAPKGAYQINVRSIALAGLGDLMQRYLELKAKLEAEGLFDAARKRALPFMPRRIAIVTSEAGAVIHDMCTVLSRRFPNLEIRLFPSLVQGADAPRTIIAGVNYFNGLLDDDASDFKPDVLIVARGGGSFEDLFCFNDEALVRAVAASKIPTISAVGHETDFTLCDFAADRRAGTPSIAAEIAVPVLADLRAQIAGFDSKLASSLRAAYEWHAQRVDHLAESLAPSLVARVADCAHRIDTLSRALDASIRFAATRREAAFGQLKAKLELLSPYAVLDRGYSLTTDASGAIVRSAAQVRKGDVLNTRLAEGSIVSRVGDGPGRKA